MQFLDTYPLIIPIAAILLAEFTKAMIDLFTRRHKIRFIKPGGMPSGHSAFVAALAVVVAFREGVSSTAFTITAVFAVIVMYDAISIRGEAGKHAKALNKMDPAHNLLESLGHNIWEVIAGAIFGALVAFALLSV